MYAVLETTKCLTTALNKRCTVWISPTLYGLLYSAGFVLATLLLQAGTGFQIVVAMHGRLSYPDDVALEDEVQPAHYINQFK